MDTNLIIILLLVVNLGFIVFVVNKLTSTSDTPQSDNFKNGDITVQNPTNGYIVDLLDLKEEIESNINYV